jgi:hypothetical protein
MEIPLAQLVEWWLTRQEVPGSIPIVGIAFFGDKICSTVTLAPKEIIHNDQNRKIGWDERWYLRYHQGMMARVRGGGKCNRIALLPKVIGTAICS